MAGDAVCGHTIVLSVIWPKTRYVIRHFLKGHRCCDGEVIDADICNMCEIYFNGKFKYI